MWHIEETSEDTQTAQISYDDSKYGKGFPQGFNGEQEHGFSFFEVKRSGEELEYITSRMIDVAVLTAVTRAQFECLGRYSSVVAKPCLFTWRKDYIDVVMAVILREGRVFIARRGPTQSFPGKWEFPGGHVEKGETYEESLIREIREELGMGILVGDRILEFEYDYGRLDGKKHRFFAFRCQVLEGEPSLTVHDEYAWVRPEELSSYDIIEADRQLVRRLV